MDIDRENERARKAMKRLALGCDLTEITEEYVVDSDTKVVELQKKKIVTKQMPPDIEAYRMLYGGAIYDNLTDEELEREKERLLRQLLSIEKKEK